MSMQPWNDWYHCMCNTYGTWLRGDPRGWRTRHHREHVVGDYRHPPPAASCERLLERSRRLLKRDPICLSSDQQQRALEVMVKSCEIHSIESIAASLDDHHLHLLARFPDHNPRKWVGIAKKNAARALSDLGMVGQGGVWGKRSQCDPITSRAHQVAVFRYIQRHATQGAIVWTFNQSR
jgi:REP element-mobilizing transposase RayT